MALCPCCIEREGNKKNTHFLTDAIIRPCLNEDGSNEREKGLYFDVSTKTVFSKAKFQRATTPEGIEETFGRPATDDEIEEAKKIPFSVDYVFCSECEKLFTEIETTFMDNYLSIFRDGEFEAGTSISFEPLSFRLFFLLQVWRTAVCNPEFKVSSEVMEKLRKLILKPDEQELKTFPLNITYLKTSGDAYPSNMVGYTVDGKYALIFFCDFLIQFYEDIHQTPFHELYGVNDKSTFHKFVNYREKEFLVKVLSNEQREAVLNRIHSERAGPVLNILATVFVRLWERTYRNSPSQEIIQKYVKALVETNGVPQGQWLSEDRVSGFTVDFVNKRGQL